MLALAVYITSPAVLIALLTVLLLGILYYKAMNFLFLLRRMRWLLLFLLVIYGFNTPGEYIREWPFEFAPTYEGVLLGLQQVGRISIMLASVALLLKTTSRNHLMAGFFLMLYPLGWLKFNPERLAVRLWLTLHYAEEAPPVGSLSGFLDSLDKLESIVATASASEKIRFELPDMSWKDALAVLIPGTGVYLL